ncbi:MAG: GFA family protein [Hyphomicrobiales bacterium]
MRGKLRGIVACHCSQCARTTGHHVAATHCATADFSLDKGETLRWYRSSAEAERGFCARCGSNLFWRKIGGAEGISITGGTLDRPTGLKIQYHIFCASKSDYYDITDGLPQYDGWPRAAV